MQEQVESLGPVVGPLIFVLTMASVEMIPLFPTQPFLLASGLLFGPVQVYPYPKAQNFIAFLTIDSPYSFFITDQICLNLASFC